MRKIFEAITRSDKRFVFGYWSKNMQQDTPTPIIKTNAEMANSIEYCEDPMDTTMANGINDPTAVSLDLLENKGIIHKALVFSKSLNAFKNDVSVSAIYYFSNYQVVGESNEIQFLIIKDFKNFICYANSKGFNQSRLATEKENIRIAEIIKNKQNAVYIRENVTDEVIDNRYISLKPCENKTNSSSVVEDIYKESKKQKESQLKDLCIMKSHEDSITELQKKQKEQKLKANLEKKSKEEKNIKLTKNDEID